MSPPFLEPTNGSDLVKMTQSADLRPGPVMVEVDFSFKGSKGEHWRQSIDCPRNGSPLPKKAAHTSLSPNPALSREHLFHHQKADIHPAWLPPWRAPNSGNAFCVTDPLDPLPPPLGTLRLSPSATNLPPISRMIPLPTKRTGLDKGPGPLPPPPGLGHK
jgi:hypothetical protein